MIILIIVSYRISILEKEILQHAVLSIKYSIQEPSSVVETNENILYVHRVLKAMLLSTAI